MANINDCAMVIMLCFIEFVPVNSEYGDAHFILLGILLESWQVIHFTYAYGRENKMREISL